MVRGGLRGAGDDPPQSPPNTEGFRVRAANNTGAAVNFTARVRCLTLGA